MQHGKGAILGFGDVADAEDIAVNGFDGGQILDAARELDVRGQRTTLGDGVRQETQERGHAVRDDVGMGEQLAEVGGPGGTDVGVGKGARRV